MCPIAYNPLFLSSSDLEDFSNVCAADNYTMTMERMFLLNNVRCEGHEEKLVLCGHDGFEKADCITREAAGVRCTKRK